ncbi:trehalose-phosphatase [Phreatobacter stygius]|uniref:trehalose-phosphatase n=1 Tax=Phreatobacter stygius TaxID=1940610 RepID=UPI0014777748|nr:trehalose-phosphatase [Phreatobacter stygius]
MANLWPDHPAGPSADHLARLIAATPADFALYFDVDGTLIDIAETPEQVTAPADLAGDLAALQRRLGGAVAVVTGRRLAEVEAILAPIRVIGSGMHGLEFLGVAETRHQAASAGAVGPEAWGTLLPRSLVDGVVRLAASIPGLRLEQKGPILTVHYREIPSVGARVEAALAVLLADHGDGYHLKTGRAVVELIPNGTSKGTAIARIMATAPFAGRRPIMIGDDHADEDAFAVARAAGGFGLTVAGEHFNRGDEPFRGAAHVRSWIAGLNAGLAQ